MPINLDPKTIGGGSFDLAVTDFASDKPHRLPQPTLDQLIGEHHLPRKSRTLWRIGEDMAALDDLVDELEGDITGLEDVIDQWFAENESQLKSKLDNYASFILELEARAEARKEEAARISHRARVDVNAASMLRERARLFFDLRKMKSIETLRHRITLCNNGGKSPLQITKDVRVEDLPAKYRIPQPDKIDVEAIRKDLEAGVKLEYASLGERGTHLRIK